MISLPDSVKVIVGLGNPGKTYSGTYHNAGFMALDYLIPTKNKKWRRGGSKWQFLKSDGRIFLRPLTFMNLSGKAIKNALNYFQIPPAEMLVIHDDADLELGSIKLSFGRGAGGHRGVASIQQALGTKNFWRLRIGIREKTKHFFPAGRRPKAGEFVLQKMPAAAARKIYSALTDVRVKVKEN